MTFELGETPCQVELNTRVQEMVKKHCCLFSKTNDAVTKMIITGTGPTMRHVSCTLSFAFGWFFDMINLDPMTQIRFC